MKIEIFNLIIENINKLNPLDFIIIFVLFTLVVFDCYYFFRWIYRDVFESQRKSLQIKNGIISDLEKKSTLIEQQKQTIEAQMSFVSNYATFLESELKKVHHEKNKTEEERNLLKRNAFKLQYAVVLLLYAKSYLDIIEHARNIVIANMALADIGKIPRNEKAVAHLVRIADIETRIIEAMSTVDPLVPHTPEEAFEKLSSSKLPVPELAKFDFISVQEELEKIKKGIVDPCFEILRDYFKPS